MLSFYVEMLFKELERELSEKNEEIRKLRAEGGGRPDPEEMKSLQVWLKEASEKVWKEGKGEREWLNEWINGGGRRVVVRREEKKGGKLDPEGIKFLQVWFKEENKHARKEGRREGMFWRDFLGLLARLLNDFLILSRRIGWERGLEVDLGQDTVPVGYFSRCPGSSKLLF